MGTRKELRPVTIDWDRLDEWAATVDVSARELLVDALHRARSADRHQAIVTRVRDVLAQEAPGRRAVAVVFDQKQGDEALFLTSDGAVLFTDGSTDYLDFTDLDESFLEEFGSVGDDFGLGVDLRTGTVDVVANANTLFQAYGFPGRG